MMQIKQLTPYISEVRVPFFDIYTKVFLVKTPGGDLLFDTATYPTDITDIVLPALASLGVDAKTLSHIFISHPHRDHAGGLPTLLSACPNATVVAGSSEILRDNPTASLLVAKDGDCILDALTVVAIPGHTRDAIALLDTRTSTLLSGDCLQLYGIFGTGNWGANITYPTAYFAALDRLLAAPPAEIYPAHTYHPVGEAYIGKDSILKAIRACREPILALRDMIIAYPDEDDKAIAARFNAQKTPTLGHHVVTAIRREISTLPKE